MRAVCLLAIAHLTIAFECDGGRVLPESHVADDYCDCTDGTDERTTGACTNQPFTCPSRPHQAKTVFASRVNDGVCDCCDGADEWRAGSCPNTCVQAAVAEMEVASRSAVARVEREASGRKAAVARAQGLAQARAAIAAGSAGVEKARAVKEAAEASAAARLADREARLAVGEVEAALKLREMSAELLGVALARLTLAKEVSGADALHDLLSASESISGMMADVDSADVIMVAMEAKEARQQEEAGSSSAAGDECVEAPNACAHEAELLALLPLASLSIEEMHKMVRTRTHAPQDLPAAANSAGCVCVHPTAGFGRCARLPSRLVRWLCSPV